MMRREYLIFGFWLGHPVERKEEKGKREEEKKKKEERKERRRSFLGMDYKYGYLFGILELWYGIVRICMELFGIYVRNSFFVYVWVRITLTLQYMCILVGLSQF